MRESGKLYILYLSAGVAAIPAGLIYALFAVNGYDRWWTAVPCIGLGFWMARETWKYLSLRLQKPIAPVIAINVGAKGFGVRFTAAAVVASAFVVPAVPLPTWAAVQMTQNVAVVWQGHFATTQDRNALLPSLP
ncbi:MAG: hypothetical protein DMG32_07795 [Acidobacteria bacterium]|nr:MAG: hypothetical protein DMG32_07795 [Acidobacteriota bacterium]